MVYSTPSKRSERVAESRQGQRSSRVPRAPHIGAHIAFVQIALLVCRQQYANVTRATYDGVRAN